MVEELVLKKLLDQLEGHLLTIEKMSFTLSELEANIDIQHLIERRLQLVIEICIDIASHIAASEKLPGREKAADVFLLLGENGIIDSDLSKRMARAVGFRNILIHEYAKIDEKLVFQYYTKDLSDVRLFAKEIAGRYLGQ